MKSVTVRRNSALGRGGGKTWLRHDLLPLPKSRKPFYRHSTPAKKG